MKARSEISHLLGGRDQKTIRDWEGPVRQVLWPGDLDFELECAESLGTRLATHEDAGASRDAERRYGDDTVRSLNCEYTRLVRRVQNKGGTKVEK